MSAPCQETRVMYSAQGHEIDVHLSTTGNTTMARVIGHDHRGAPGRPFTLPSPHAMAGALRRVVGPGCELVCVSSGGHHSPNGGSTVTRIYVLGD